MKFTEQIEIGTEIWSANCKRGVVQSYAEVPNSKSRYIRVFSVLWDGDENPKPMFESWLRGYFFPKNPETITI